MSVLFLAWKYLIERPWNTALNVVLLSLGVAVIVVLLLFSSQMERKIEDHVNGIDLVLGAKGSPMQIILCSIFHIDYPTGNILLSEAERVSRSRFIKQAIPLALGDSYQSYRIVGTQQAYPELYGGKLKEGSWWKGDFEVTLGSDVAKKLGLTLGDLLTSSHGLISDADKHEASPFTVKGIMKPTGTVMDNLILTSIESIWKIHDHNETEYAEVPLPDSVERSSLIASVPKNDSTHEITSLLILYQSPRAAIQLPRLVDEHTSMKAASPAFETARLFSMLGVGVEVLMSFAYVLILISALSIFIALYNSLKERNYDLAIMRSMGASRFKLCFTVLLEGMILTLLGSILGIGLGHAVLIAVTNISDLERSGINGALFFRQEWMILAGSLLLGLTCAALPGAQAYRTDISKVLAAGK